MVGAQASLLCALIPRFLLHTSFVSPLIILWLWTKPIARDFLHQAPLGEVPLPLCASGGGGEGVVVGWVLCSPVSEAQGEALDPEGHPGAGEASLAPSLPSPQAVGLSL